MIIIMKPQATEEQIGALCDSLGKQGMQVQRNAGVDCTVLGVLGDVAKLDPHDFLIQPGVERVMPVSEPFKKANRKFHPTDSVIDCGGVKVGGRKLAFFRGSLLGGKLRPDHGYRAEGSRKRGEHPARRRV